jgi:hypothetical protein
MSRLSRAAVGGALLAVMTVGTLAVTAPPAAADRDWHSCRDRVVVVRERECRPDVVYVRERDCRPDVIYRPVRIYDRRDCDDRRPVVREWRGHRHCD